MLRSVGATIAPSYKFWLLTAFLALVFATGGASRTDVQSIAILHPAAILLCAIACMTLQKKHVEHYKWVFGMFFAIFCLTAFHLIPLPPVLWQALPGRAQLTNVEQLVELKNIWRPLTTTPMNGWHALASLATPLAVLLVGVQFNRSDLYRMLTVLVVLAIISGFIGLLQIIGEPNGLLYFYRITNNGSAVGLFANRNHAATLLACLFPMLAVFASTFNGTADRRRGRLIIAAAFTVILIPLILVTGSRSGLLIGIVGLAGGAFLFQYRSTDVQNKKRLAGNFGLKSLLISLFAVGTGVVTYFLSRAQSIERILSTDANKDNRAEFWKISTDLFWEYFPWGSGSGSFVEAYKILEPVDLLSPTYLNHAHSDWFEIAVTFGVPGLLLLAVGLILYLCNIVLIFRRMDGALQPVVYARMSAICIGMIAVASLGDYPLRTPIIASVFTAYILWFSAAKIDGISDTTRQTLDD